MVSFSSTAPPHDIKYYCTRIAIRSDPILLLLLLLDPRPMILWSPKITRDGSDKFVMTTWRVYTTSKRHLETGYGTHVKHTRSVIHLDSIIKHACYNYTNFYHFSWQYGNVRVVGRVWIPDGNNHFHGLFGTNTTDIFVLFNFFLLSIFYRYNGIL